MMQLKKKPSSFLLSIVNTKSDSDSEVDMDSCVKQD